MYVLFQDRKQAGEELAIILKEHLIHSNGILTNGMVQIKRFTNCVMVY
jgi:hypothetical protein